MVLIDSEYNEDDLGSPLRQLTNKYFVCKFMYHVVFLL